MIPEEHIPTEPTPIGDGLIAGPAADIIAGLRAEVGRLVQSEAVYKTMATALYQMLGEGSYAVPFAVFDAGAHNVMVDVIEDAGLVVFYRQPLAESGEGQ